MRRWWRAGVLLGVMLGLLIAWPGGGAAAADATCTTRQECESLCAQQQRRLNGQQRGMNYQCIVTAGPQVIVEEESGETTVSGAFVCLCSPSGAGSAGGGDGGAGAGSPPILVLPGGGGRPVPMPPGSQLDVCLRDARAKHAEYLKECPGSADQAACGQAAESFRIRDEAACMNHYGRRLRGFQHLQR